ncbi:MAG: hypothetical protein JO130_18550 [Solirubrobacterales bacterium]|nr:hypothetical protein [Solirubrobacterales bacterium]
MISSIDPPVFITVRDRVVDLCRLVAWLERAGHQRIVLLDNASTYEPVVEYLRSTPHDVVCLGKNLGSRALWHAGLAPRDEWFVLTDPDVVPLDDCPHDAVRYLHDLLLRYGGPKAALGLYLGDVPGDLGCLPWERQLLDPWPGDSWRGRLAPGVFDSLSDTTFALYPPGGAFGYHALRTGWPYQARHMPWYEPATDEERAERAYYLAHAKGGCEGSSYKDGLQA